MKDDCDVQVLLQCSHTAPLQHPSSNTALSTAVTQHFLRNVSLLAVQNRPDPLVGGLSACPHVPPPQTCPAPRAPNPPMAHLPTILALTRCRFTGQASAAKTCFAHEESFPWDLTPWVVEAEGLNLPGKRRLHLKCRGLEKAAGGPGRGLLELTGLLSLPPPFSAPRTAPQQRPCLWRSST